MIKQVLEASLEGELDQHLSDEKSSEGNRRNGRTQKNLKSSLGTFEISTPRDRDSSFRPQTIEKRQTQLPGDLEEKILGLYGLGMSYSDIQAHLKEMYGISVSDGTINTITDRVIPAIREWQSRILEPDLCHCMDGCDALQDPGRGKDSIESRVQCLRSEFGG